MRIKKYLIFAVIAFMGCSSTPPIKKVEIKSSDDITDMRAKIDDLNNRVYVLNEQMESLRSRLRDTAPAALPKSAAKDTTPVKKPVVREKAVSSAESEYSNAYDLYKDKKYAKAMIAFSSFVEKYPDSVLTDHAQYWLAECYYQQKEYALAVDEFTKILKKYPKGSKAPAAMLRIAMSYKELGEKKETDSYLKELISRFPASQAASAAKAMVENKQ